MSILHYYKNTDYINFTTMRNIKGFVLFFLFIFLLKLLPAQNMLHIGICKDADSKEFNKFSEQLKTEISRLTDSKYELSYIELSSNMDTLVSLKNIETMMSDPKIDYVISLGYIASNQIAHLKSYPKPVIAATILDGELQALPLNDDHITGVNNFTYLESIIRLKKNLQEFSRIFETKDIVVIIPEVFKDNFPSLDQYFANNKADYNITLISVKDDINAALSAIPASAEGAIVLPMIGFQSSDIKQMFDYLNEHHIPSLAVNGVSYLNLGASITLTPEFTFQQLARQIALRILKISEGTNPSKIPIDIDYKNVSIINMESLRTVGKFPKWNILNESILLNVTNISSARNLNLRMSISDALENNLQGKIAAKEVEVADREVRIAKANILPQVSIGGSAVGLSTNLVEASMGQKGEFTLTGSASIKQVIFSESVFANIKINELMAENKRFYNKQAVLDIVANTSTAYITLLFTKSNLLIQNENVNTTTKNLEMAKARESAGQTSVSDVNRWVSELNMNKMKFNDAYTNFRSSMYQMNQMMNTDISAAINITDSTSIDETIFVNQELLKQIFENPVLTERYASFIIDEMRRNSPEIQQIESMVDILDRKSKLYKNQWFMPELVAFGGADQAFIREGTIMPVGMPVPPPPDDMTFNYGVSLRIPIFQGGKASAEAKKIQIQLDQLGMQKEDLENKLEIRIRSNIQKLRASALELELSKNAADAAASNFKMVQDAYFQGAVNLIQLIDAQNMMNQTKYMANVSYYQFALDYLLVERYQGKFTFLSTDEEKQDYIKRLQNYILKK